MANGKCGNGGNGNENAGLLCVACGRRTRVLRTDLCCPSCHNNYKTGAVEAALKGHAIPKYSWVLERARATFADIEAERVELQSDFDALTTRVAEMVTNRIKEVFANVEMPQDVIAEVTRRFRDDIWASEGGNKLYAQLKVAGQILDELENLAKDITARFPSKKTATLTETPITARATTA